MVVRGMALDSDLVCDYGRGVSDLGSEALGEGVVRRQGDEVDIAISPCHACISFE